MTFDCLAGSPAAPNPPPPTPAPPPPPKQTLTYNFFILRCSALLRLLFPYCIERDDLHSRSCCRCQCSFSLLPESLASWPAPPIASHPYAKGVCVGFGVFGVGGVPVTLFLQSVTSASRNVAATRALQSGSRQSWPVSQLLRGAPSSASRRNVDLLGNRGSGRQFPIVVPCRPQGVLAPGDPAKRQTGDVDDRRGEITPSFSHQVRSASCPRRGTAPGAALTTPRPRRLPARTYSRAASLLAPRPAGLAVVGDDIFGYLAVGTGSRS